MCTYTVYRHTAPNGKMYVGITKVRPKSRWDNGRGYRNNEYFSHAIAKYGWDNFKHEILLEGLTVDEASLAEKIFIGYWDLTNRNKGYNLESGGVANWEITDETRRKISEAQIGRKASEETKRKMSEARRGERNPMYGKHTANYGKHLTEEHRRKISEAHKGKRHTEETKQLLAKINTGKHLSLESRRKISKPVYQLDKNTHEIIQRFESITEAATAVGVKNPSTNIIGRCCSGKIATVYGFVWQYAEGGDIA